MRRVYLAIGLVIVLLLSVVGGVYWYFFGAPNFPADQLVPSETLFFATIPNAVPLLAGYETSDLKKLAEDPNAQNIAAALNDTIGQKNLDLLQAFLPELSGQSFLALTHFDPDHPEASSFIAGLKPLPGSDHFQDFVTKFKQVYGNELTHGSSGNDSMDGATYAWFQPAGFSNRICVLHQDGWIITTYGPEALKDWLQRYRKQSTSPSLAQNPNYQTCLQRVGVDSQTVFYLNTGRLLKAGTEFLQKQKLVPSVDIFTQDFQTFNLVMIGSKFQDGKIIDNTSVLLTPTGKADLGLSDTPCGFDTLKFTSKNTCLYLAGTRDWNRVSQRISHNLSQLSPDIVSALTLQAQTIKKMGVDLQHNLVDALGPEFSLQLDWAADAPFPDAAFFLKVDKPDDFQPVIQALHTVVHDLTLNSGVLTEVDVNGQKFLTYHSATPSAFSPTITENGPYFGCFLTQKYGVDSMTRDVNGTLKTNPLFQAGVGDKLTSGNATDMVFMDSPNLLDHTYRATLPYVSLAAMANKDARNFLRDHQLPKDLSWLAPIGAWTTLQYLDEGGLRSTSISGLGNQGIYFGAAFAGVKALAPSLLPKTTITPTPPLGAETASATPPDNKNAEAIRDELSQLRYTVQAWSKDKKIAPGTPVTWPALAGYFVPESLLEKNGGQDALGHAYDLGVVGVRGADVSPETKKAFPDKPDAFWDPKPDEFAFAPASTPLENPAPPMTNAAPAPAMTNTPPATPPMTNAAPVTPAPAMTNTPPATPPMTNAAPEVPPSTNTPPSTPPQSSTNSPHASAPSD